MFWGCKFHSDDSTMKTDTWYILTVIYGITFTMKKKKNKKRKMYKYTTSSKIWRKRCLRHSPLLMVDDVKKTMFKHPQFIFQNWRCEVYIYICEVFSTNVSLQDHLNVDLKEMFFTQYVTEGSLFGWNYDLHPLLGTWIFWTALQFDHSLISLL